MRPPEEFKALTNAGALPPAEESSDDGRVEREVDVMSEPPEIDTTRAEEHPRRTLCVLWCILPSLTLGGFCILSILVFVVIHSKCSVSDAFASIATLNTSTLLYNACQPQIDQHALTLYL